MPKCPPKERGKKGGGGGGQQDRDYDKDNYNHNEEGGKEKGGGAQVALVDPLLGTGLGGCESSRPWQVPAGKPGSFSKEPTTWVT